MRHRFAAGVVVALAGIFVLGLVDAREQWPYGMFLAVFAAIQSAAFLLVYPDIERALDRRRRRRQASR